MKRTPEVQPIDLPPPDVSRTLPISGPPFQRPSPDLIRRLDAVGSATASAVLHRLGVRQTFIQGPLPRKPGSKVIGPAVTLQFMPQREDVASGLGQEKTEKVTALWAVFETVQPGDVLVVQAWGDMYTGCMGEMLLTYFMGRGGAGVVVDGCIRDWPHIQQMPLPVWTRGFTPNYASQGTLFPWAYNVPIACARVLVLPGDIIIADDDGAVLVPINLAEVVIQHTVEHEEWEVFSRIRLAEGGDLRKYYPLNEEGWAEYEAWKATQSAT
ncbi:MAG: ribonuclease activity regulator RraA [Chloroflexales bacterium]|nr:ribonuclease activity regulator RraA [Chloroflexales bacterium]